MSQRTQTDGWGQNIKKQKLRISVLRQVTKRLFEDYD